MTLRWLAPVHSPLPLAAVARGVATSLNDAALRRAQSELDRWVRESYAPAWFAWMDSGTSALTAALRLATEGRTTRRIALPAYGCYDLATACDGAGVEVVLYDVDPTTLGPDWESLERAFASGAVAVVVAHLYGVPVDLDAVATLAERHGALVIEDAAQGIGGSYHGLPLGARGNFGVLSFGRGKGLTGGGGGLLLARGDHPGIAALGELPSAGRGFGAICRGTAQALLSRPSIYRLPASLPLGLGETRYRSPQPPRRILRGSVGILAGNISGVAAEAVRRRATGARWSAALTEMWRTGLVRSPNNATPGCLRLPLVAPGAGPAEFARTGLRAHGVSGGYPLSLRDLPGFGARVVVSGEIEPAGARLLAERLITLPTHRFVRATDIDAVVEALACVP